MKIEVKCPVCKEWQSIEQAALGVPTLCRNCNQTVAMVPRSSGARKLRRSMQVLIVIGGVVLCLWLWQRRANEVSRELSSTLIQDASGR